MTRNLKSLGLVRLCSLCHGVSYAQLPTHYDVAAYVWPAYQPDPRFQDIGVFKDGKGEWEAIYNAKPKFAGHNQPPVP